MTLAHPPPLVGAGRGGGSRGRKRLSNAPSLARRVGRRDPPPLSSPTRGEEAQRSHPRVNSRAEGASFVLTIAGLAGGMGLITVILCEKPTCASYIQPRRLSAGVRG